MRNILAAVLLVYIVYESLKVKFGYIPLVEQNPLQVAEDKNSEIEENKSGDNTENTNEENDLKNESLDTNKKEDSKNLEKKEPKEYNHQGSYSEKFVSKVVTNLLKTDEGQKFFGKLITPVGTRKIDKVVKFSDANSLHSIFASKIIEAGNGEQIANCGDDVNITYFIYDIANQLIGTKNVNTKIGSASIPLVMENIIIGMRQNEKKSSLVNSDLIDKLEEGAKFEKNNSAKIRIEIVLNKINNSESKISKNEFTYFDDGISSIQRFCLCGEFVEILVEIYTMENKLLFKDSLRFRIGNKNIPEVINLSVVGLTYDIKRILITRAKNISSIKNYKKNFNLDASSNDYIKINISLI